MATNTLSTNIGQAVNDFTDVRNAIIEKNVAVPSGTPTAQYADLIRQIQTECEPKSGQLTILDNVRIGSYGQWETWPGTDNRPYANTVAVGEDIYLISGYFNKTVEVYNTKSRIYKKLPDIPGETGLAGCVHKDGKIYVIGGFTGASNPNTNYVYTIATGTWETKTPIPTRQSAFACIEADGNIYCIGGNENVNDVYNIQTDSWSKKTVMPVNIPGSMGACVRVGRNIHLIGKSALSNDYHCVYNIDADSWSTLAVLPRPRPRGFGRGCYYEGKIYVIGGEMSDLVDIYDLATDTWEIGPSLPAPRYVEVSLIDSTIYAFDYTISSLHTFTIERIIHVNPHSVIKLDKDAWLDNETITANVEVTTGDSVSKLKVTEGTSGTIYEPLNDILITSI